jgi:hypothetical protein
MDLYLERHWRDLHARFIIYACDQLQGCLPRDLRARVEERVFVESPAGVEGDMYPVVRVLERHPRQQVPATGCAGATAEPLIVEVLPELISETFIEILDVSTGRRVITVIEVLSAANKHAGRGRRLFIRKRRDCLRGRVSLVEIDLLRAGHRNLMVPAAQLPDSHRTMYQVCVRRGWRPAHVEVYRVPLRERLPSIKVPLRETDPDVTLDLQSILDQCYQKGGYDDDIDYKTGPEPPLDGDDAAWADTLSRGQGKR